MKGLMEGLGSDEPQNKLVILKDASYDTFRKELNKAEAWVDEADKEEENRCIFFYYTGHGFQHNWTFAGLNDPEEYKYNIEGRLDALSKLKNCYVVAIFDCCREDISALEKNFDAPAVDFTPCKGSKLFLFGCEPSNNRSADNKLV